MKKDLANEILNIIEKEGAPDSQDYIAKQLNELFASLNPERVRESCEKMLKRNQWNGNRSRYSTEDIKIWVEDIISDLCSGSQDETDKIIKDLSGEKIPNIKTITSTDYSQEKEHSGLTNTEIVNKALIYYESDEGDKIGAFIKGFKEALKQ